jgi:hypothetical protein
MIENDSSPYGKDSFRADQRVHLALSNGAQKRPGVEHAGNAEQSGRLLLKTVNDTSAIALHI